MEAKLIKLLPSFLQVARYLQLVTGAVCKTKVQWKATKLKRINYHGVSFVQVERFVRQGTH